MALHPSITSVLLRISQGEERASEELFSIVYEELHAMAGWFIRRERPGHTLQPTALVNEAYLRMLGNMGQSWESRGHFFAAAGAVMRRILVDYARSRSAFKRGQARVLVELKDNTVISEDHLDLILEVDDALTRLEKQDPRQSNIVVLKFFAGLTEEEIALVLNKSPRTVKRDWKAAKAWLRAEFKTSSKGQSA